MRLPFGNARDAHLGTDQLSGYLDNQLAQDERLRVEQHLRSCATCRSELASLRQTVALLHALPRVQVPRAFTLSEVQVGARREAAAPWAWGAARALGAVAALIVVAVLAAVVLQRTGQPATSQVARAPQPMLAPAAPSAAPPTAAEESAPSATAPQPEDTAVQQPPAAAVAPTTAPTAPRTSAPARTFTAPVRPQAPQAKAASPTKPTQARTGSATATRAGGARSTQPPTAAAAAAAAAPAAPVAQPSATTAGKSSPASPSAAVADVSPLPTEDQRSMMLAAPATGPAAAAPQGMGGGGGAGGAGLGAGGGAGPAPSGEPMPTPTIASLGTTLPSGAGVVFTDHQSLTAIDSQGTHPLVQVPGISVPSISGDRAWVAYRVQHDSYADIWAVRWDGSQAHLVASEREFPGHDGTPAGPVHIERMAWVPGSNTLGLTVAIADSATPGQPRRELWTANVDGEGPHYVLELGSASQALFSPNGKTVAVLTRGSPALPQGKLSLFNADGSGERTPLEFPANVNGYGYESQLSWLPDSSGLWAGIPDANALFPESAGITLYRVPLDGTATQAGHIKALDTFWSPDGKQLAYTQPADGNPDDRQLIIAHADGSNPQSYSPLASGALASWAPDSKHFTFYSSNEWYQGGTDQKPQKLGPASSLAEVQWIAPQQLLYLEDSGSTWLLVSHTVDGKNSGLVPIPKNSDVDMTG